MPGIVSTYLFAFFLSRCYLLFMPTESPKIIFVASEDLIKRLDDYRFENRVNSRSEAIRLLLEEALKKYEKKPKK